jgi:uroporphyrinogen-III decarboxylase
MSPSRRDLVLQAIRFESPERVPVWFFNRDAQRSDVACFNLALFEGRRSEWGYELTSPGDGTMGQPGAPVIREWRDLAGFRFPDPRAQARTGGVDAFRQASGDRYRLASLVLSGFTVHAFLRGFENSMADIAGNSPDELELLDRIISFECEVMTLAAERGFDGIHLADDRGTQERLFVSPEMWRRIFRPRYARQCAHAHRLGLHVWFHSCGNILPIVCDLHEIGVDVLNISQPNVVDLVQVGRELCGRQCFMVPVSYQTVSISGGPEDIRTEARRLFDLLGSPRGGLIGYVEDYACMGMSERNYQCCADAFAALRPRQRKGACREGSK